jgi:hypothetical protein
MEVSAGWISTNMKKICKYNGEDTAVIKDGNGQLITDSVE